MRPPPPGASVGSDNERSTNLELVIPPPVELSDSADDGVSPRQQKLAMKKQLSRRKFRRNQVLAAMKRKYIRNLACLYLYVSLSTYRQHSN